MSSALNAKEIVSNFSFALLAQGAAVTMSIVTTLFLPKVLGVAEYGYWQLFIFYTGYAGIFHLGISEGIYLLNGGKTRGDLPRCSLGSQFRFSLLYQSILCFAVTACGIFLSDGSERIFVLTATSIFILLNNATYYLGYIFQAVNETKKFSMSVMLDRLTFLIPLVVCLVFNISIFQPYIVFYGISKVIALSYCIWNGREIVFAKNLSLGKVMSEAWKSIQVGSKLMVANLTSMLILGTARFIIDANWGVETFGVLSLSLSMVNFFLQFIAQLSMVLFPALRRVDDNTLIHVYSRLNDSLSLLLPVAYLLYFPLVLLISFWLPMYSDSLLYLAVLLPMCVFDGKMNVCYSTFMKVLRLEKTLLIVNCIALAVSLIASILGAGYFRNPFFVICGASVAVVVRSVLSEFLLRKRLGLPLSHMLIQDLFVSFAFVFLAINCSWEIGFLGTFLACLLLLVINRSEFLRMIRLVFHREIEE